MKAARTVVHRSINRSAGAVHEPWFQAHPIHHESFLEKCVVEILLLTPAVARIEHQPLELTYRVDGKSHSYFPDYRVTLTDGSQALVEAKGSPFVPAFLKKLDDGLRIALSELGMPTYLVPSSSVSPERSGGAADIRRLARRTAAPESLQALREWVTQREVATVAQAAKAGFDIALIGYAVGRRQLTVGPTFSLAMNQQIWSFDSYGNLHLDHWLGHPGRAEDVSTRSASR